MRVLLISPVAALDPPCGDITYTETLLKYSPAGVEYETYGAAIQRGALVERARRSRLWNEPVLTLIAKTVNVARQKRWMFWEPFRFFDIRPGEYDLIHAHVFSTAFRVRDCPLIISCGAPQRDLYLNYRTHSRQRVNWMERAERGLGRLMGVNCTSYRMPQAERIMVYTEYFRDYLQAGGYMPADRIDVIPIMHQCDAPPITPRKPTRIGFVANDFNAKGGQVLLKAFERVRATVPHAELQVVGSVPLLSADECAAKGIVWVSRVPREKLLSEYMPSFDVFAYPTPHDCFSYVMLEAMASGAAIATSDYVSMPEAVDFGKAGLISPVGDFEALARNIIKLMDSETNYRFRCAARKRFEEHFSCTAVAPRMLKAYEDSMASYREPVHNDRRTPVSSV